MAELPNVFREFLATMKRLDLEQGFDAEHGTDTADHVFDPEAGASGRGFYTPTFPRAFHAVIGSLPIDHESFAFVDVGSGKGRVLLMASDYPWRTELGIEFMPSLVEVSKKNLGLYRSAKQRCTDIRIVEGDATKADLPAEDTVFWIYNPFGRKLMSDLVERIGESCKQTPHRVVVVYFRQDHCSVLDESGFLHRWGSQGVDAAKDMTTATENMLNDRYNYAVYSNF